MQRAGLDRCKIILEDKRGDHGHVRETLEKYCTVNKARAKEFQPNVMDRNALPYQIVVLPCCLSHLT